MKARLTNYLTKDIWRIRTKDLPLSKSIFIHPLRIIMLVWRRFNEDNCQLRASALTFYTLLSVVPVVAMAFGVAKGFGLEKMLQRMLLERLQGQEEVLNQIIAFSNALLENTKGGLIAGIGVVVLFWTVIGVLGNIEASFNDIWGVKKSRTLMRKLSDYLVLMLICPILLIVSSSATIFITAQAKLLVGKIALLGAASPFIFLSLKLLPFVVIWAVFTFIYIFMPNTKVEFKSGLLAGIVAGTIYQLTQWAYITFQIGVSNYGAIYGSFAALPFFLVWLQISWLIVLVGAEIAFAYQNAETYEFERDCLEINYNFKRLLALRIVNAAAKRFGQGEPPLTAVEFTHLLDIPIRLVRLILFELVASGVFNEAIVEAGKDRAFQPALSVDHLTIKDVSDMLENKGTTNIPVSETQELKKLQDTLGIFSETIKNSPANVLLKDI